jgi:uncharacterized protein (TIGR03086 family)
MTEQPGSGPVPSAALLDLGHAALAACRSALRRVGNADLARPTPCAEYTLADLEEHLVRSMVLLGGCAGAQLGPADGATVDGRISPLGEATLSAWAARGLGGEVPLGSRMLPAEQVYTIVLLELVVHGWDVARAMSTSADSDLDFTVPTQVVDHLLGQAPVLITADKRGRAFAQAVEVAADAAPLQRLIAFTGRTP